MAERSQHPGAGLRLNAVDQAREARFDRLSRELRLCLDSDGCISHAGGAWQATLGGPPSAAIGRHWTSIVAKADHSAMRAAIQHALSLDQPHDGVELRIAIAGAEPRIVDWTFARGPGGDAILAVGSERTAEAMLLRREIAELEAHIEQLSEHSKSMEGFAATAAHQLSEPLIVAESGTIMITEELGDALDPDLRARLDAIGRGAARARQMVDALLLDARSSGALELRPVDAERVVARVLDDLAPRLDERGVVTKVGPLPAVLAEPRLLGVLFHNLIGNAIKYGPREGGPIEISAERAEDSWRLSVTSSGAPLEPHETTRVFEPWQRIPGERRAPGSGLGLAICKRLVDRLGGTIGCEPLPAGNRFYFVLPAA